MWLSYYSSHSPCDWTILLVWHVLLLSCFLSLELHVSIREKKSLCIIFWFNGSQISCQAGARKESNSCQCVGLYALSWDLEAVPKVNLEAAGANKPNTGSGFKKDQLLQPKINLSRLKFGSCLSSHRLQKAASGWHVDLRQTCRMYKPPPTPPKKVWSMM